MIFNRNVFCFFYQFNALTLCINLVNIIFDPFHTTWLNKSVNFQTFEWLYIKMLALVIQSCKNNTHLRSVKWFCNFLAQKSNASISFLDSKMKTWISVHVIIEGMELGTDPPLPWILTCFLRSKHSNKPKRLMFSHICQFVLLFFGFEMDWGNQGAKRVLA